jgi:hypothetical protein
MSILASDVFAQIRAQLDDDFSDRYKEASDLVPAVNAAVRYLVQVLNVAFEQKKLAPEALRELIRVDIVPVTGSGNVRKANITAAALSIWTILGVEPSPVVHEDTSTTVAPEDYWEVRNKLADRLTLEEWQEQSEDPFSAGSLQSIPSVFARAAYVGPGRYFDAVNDYIMIRPGSLFIQEFAGIWYLQNPTVITAGTDSVEFPQSVFNMLVDKSLNYISRQHGPEDKLGAVTEKEVIQVISLISA